ncbi:MAG: hypothetical protein WBA63_14530 [Thermomicrobiales bacterium]
MQARIAVIFDVGYGGAVTVMESGDRRGWSRFGTSVVATETGMRNAADWLPHPEISSMATKAMFYRALEELCRSLNGMALCSRWSRS